MKSNLNVLVTGGAGYIGSQVCKNLFLNGFNPVVVDNLVYGHIENVKWGNFFKIDLKDRKKVFDFFSKNKFIAVIHLAAYAYVGESVEKPQKYYENNVLTSLNLLDAMIENKIKNIVFSSSCATYGLPTQLPITEQQIQLPINPYGNSKLFVERIIQDYANAYDMNFGILRYFNVAGADIDQEIGELHIPETHLIPLAIQAAYDKNFTLKVFGNDYNTTDGSAIRDYIHVYDLADAHILTLKKIISSRKSLTLNLGAGKGYSVIEVINQIEKYTKMKVKYEFADRRAGDPQKLFSSIKMAEEKLNWSPKYSNIEKIVETAVLWYRKVNSIL